MMSASRLVRFDDAFDRAKAILKDAAAEVGGRLVLLRDVQGRIAILSDAPQGPAAEMAARRLSQSLGGFAPDPSDVWLSPADFFDAERVFASPDTRRLFVPGVDDGPANAFVLERSITGLDWLRPSIPSVTSDEPARLAFFGLKGGVGRSTALVLAARALARAGARVLVLDLDLESPGLGHVLLPSDQIPTFGIVDYLVEEAVGQADDELLREMVASSPLVSDGKGEIRVVPAAGNRGQFLAKLGRAYQPTAGVEGTLELAERVDAMVTKLAEDETADVVLFDSRAGLHDLAAFVVTRLRAETLLFAVNTAQTWRGYRLLFDDWRRHPRLAELREGLRMVAALVPETGREDYLRRFEEEGHALFSDTLYEEAQADDVEAFNFDVHDGSAPHHPLPVYWSRALQEFDPAQRPGAVTDDQLLAAASEFCRGVGEMLDREVRP